MKKMTKFWKLIFLFCLFCSLIFTSLPSYALTVKDVPNPRQQNGGWVTDMVDMLSPQAETKLNQMISDLEKENGTEIAVVTVPTTKTSDTPKQFTTELFNTWGIGKKGQDNGVLFLISKGDRRTEIETGYGIESILTDAKVGNIIRQKVTPQFKQGNFEAGILAGTKSLIQELGGDIKDAEKNHISHINWSFYTNWLINLGVFILLFGRPIFKNLIYPLFHRDYLSPSGTTRRSHIKGKVFCKECSQQMQQVKTTDLESYLNQPQKVANKLNSAKFQGWQCQHCIEEITSPKIHLLIQEKYSYGKSRCPNCEELTVTNQSTKVIKPATKTTTGIRRKQLACQCCSYTSSKDETISRLYTSTTSSSSSSSTSSSSSSSSSSSYSSSSSSSDFGGGDSGGGGAGGDW